MWLARLFSKLPFSFIYGLSSVLSFLVFKVAGYRKKIIRENLMYAFPGRSETWYQQEERQFYQNFVDVWLESVKSLDLTRQDFIDRVQVNDYQLLARHLDANQSCLVLSGHTGNWEWLILRFSAVPKLESEATYQTIQNKTFDDLMLKIRSQFGAVMIERKKILRALLQRRHLTRAIAMISDQGPSKHSEMHYWRWFLNRPASFYLAPAKIAISQNLPVLFTGMLRTGRGRYTVYFKEIALPPYGANAELEITDKFVQLVEENLRQQPSSYLWSHRRWKRRPRPTDFIRTD